jgi:type I restriction enzyme S subunit
MWTTAPASKVAEHSVLPGDILLTPSSETADDIGHAARVASAPPNILYSYHILRFRKETGYDASFLTYCFNAVPIRSYFESVCTGTTRKVLVRDDFKSAPFAIPSLAEQTAIADFLDGETGKIDGLVAEQRRLMELLKEKRQAVISHAVTKGLNSHAPMKPSGIEWLGEVPAHWKVVPIKWLSPVKRGASPRPIDDPKYFDEEGEYAWVRIADVSACDGVLSETTQRLSPLGSSLSVKILPNELFVSIAGTVGKPCISAIKACIHDGFVYFPALKINPWFLFRIFEAGDCYGGLGKWGTQLNLNTDTVGSIRIAIPPADEMHQLLKFIDDESSRFDTLTAEAQRAIDLLQERRTALISAAITGQIDVRKHPKN